jgi:hypothetical protein
MDFEIFPHSLAKAYPFLVHLTLVNIDILPILHYASYSNFWPNLVTLSVSLGKDNRNAEVFPDLHSFVTSFGGAGANLQILRFSKDGDFSDGSLMEIDGEDWIAGPRVFWPNDTPIPSNFHRL